MPDPQILTEEVISWLNEDEAEEELGNEPPVVEDTEARAQRIDMNAANTMAEAPIRITPAVTTEDPGARTWRLDMATVDYRPPVEIPRINYDRNAGPLCVPQRAWKRINRITFDISIVYNQEYENPRLIPPHLSYEEVVVFFVPGYPSHSASPEPSQPIQGESYEAWHHRIYHVAPNGPQGVTQPIVILLSQIPANLRDAQGRFISLAPNPATPKLDPVSLKIQSTIKVLAPEPGSELESLVKAFLENREKLNGVKIPL